MKQRSSWSEVGQAPGLRLLARTAGPPRPPSKSPWGSLTLAVLLLCSCGYVGDPQPPALRVPIKIDNLAAVQRGDHIIIQFVAPDMTTEGLRLTELGEIDLRIGKTVEPWHEPTWSNNAKPIELDGPTEPGPVRTQTPVENWLDTEVIVGVRVSNRRGRWSAWSNLVALNLVQPLVAPRDFRVEAIREGVRLSWRPGDARPGLRFRVFRRAEGSNTQVQLGETEQMEWTDTTARIGETYAYNVLAVAPAGDDLVQSDLPEPVSITPADVFPPTVPTRLTAITGLTTIELTWESSQDTGPVTYRMYRADGEGEPRVISDQLRAPSYSDKAVISGKRYRYAVSAIDETGNESEPSATAEQVAP